MARFRGTGRSETIIGGPGDDTISGRGGKDTVYGGDGNDVLDGGGRNDHVYGGDGDDLIYGDAGDDRLYGNDGNDTIFGDVGDEEVFGGAGNDVLYGLKGNDEIFGDTGNDTFIIDAGNHKIVGGEDADGNDIDVLDLSRAGNYTITYTGPESGIIYFYNPGGQLKHTATFKEIERIICFTPGSMIATMQGERPVATLRAGDKVFTRDNGAQEIQWIGRKKISVGAGSLSETLQPIMIKQGALGFGLPEKDLVVSPNHRVLMKPNISELLFEAREVLVAAKHLLGMPGIERLEVAEIEYVHFLCEGHEIVLSNGAWTETFQPGDYSMGGLGSQQRNEIFTLFPELKDRAGVQAYGAARKTLKRYEAELLRASA